MTKDYFFGKAKWVSAYNASPDGFYVLRGKFNINSANKVSLNVLGLGFFKCYVNGVCINPDTFLPLSSDYEATCDPSAEILSGHRIYVPTFDVTQLVNKGENTIAIHFGGGWYTFFLRRFGLPKAIYRITSEDTDSVCEYVSDESCRIGKSYVDDYLFVNRERHNYKDFPECFGKDYIDSAWEHATAVEDVICEYCETDCPKDALIEKLDVKKIKDVAGGAVYDCGQNTVGYPVLSVRAEQGESVKVVFSEEILADGSLNMEHSHSQEFTVISDGTSRISEPEFTWFGFRYFEVFGDAVPECVKVVHANVPVSSSFESDNETLNWTYRTFVHTMLCNMHTGIPSDCPHIERRGYTGDGQLSCHAALSVLDAESFYRKWLQDIADSQDTLSGHIQYTAPYIFSGGGPGGWGCAIIEVAYQLYRHSGDAGLLSRYYTNMCRYIDYLRAHSEFGLVTSDKEGDWCLGDWCGPNIIYPEKNITVYDQQVILPAPMVNTYFLVKSLNTLAVIADTLEKSEDALKFKDMAKYHSRAIQAAYFNSFDGNFIMNVQGANAFAVDLGLGDESTYPNLVSYYTKLGCFDTGIFGTDILTRVLFERKNAELAVKLLTGDGAQGFEKWRKGGATTFHEYWDSERSRSHNHHMFGAPVAYFFEYLLGIRQADDSAGYRSLVIEPLTVSSVGRMSGSMKTPQGEVAVSYEKNAEKINFTVLIPENTEAIFKYSGKELALKTGKNELHFNNAENN